MKNISVLQSLHMPTHACKATKLCTLFMHCFGRSFQIVFFFLVCFNYAPLQGVSAAANEPNRPSDSPAIIALSGFNLYSSLFGPEYFPVYTENYLANALDKAWPDKKMCGNFRLCEIIDINWGGDLQNTSAVNEYIRLVRETIIAIRKRDPNRTIIVVAHSWGSVVAYQALSSITRSEMLNNSVALLVSLGSPLGSQCSRWLSDRLSLLYRNLPGRDIIGASLRKPPIVDQWRNMWNVIDPVSGPIEKTAADENYQYNFPVLNKAELKLQKCNLATIIALRNKILTAHSDYYDGIALSLVRGWVDAAISREISGNCSNIITVKTTIPKNYGSPFNLFVRPQRPLFEAVCKGGSTVQILAGHNYPEQWTHIDGYHWDGARWVKFQFNGSDRGGGGNQWFRGRASANIPVSSLSKQSNKWFVAYTCWNNNGEWKCGCDTPACREKLWQVQGFEFR